jgi:hypothetical protein
VSPRDLAGADRARRPLRALLRPARRLLRPDPAGRREPGAIFVAIATVDFPTATIAWVAFIIVYQRVENSFIQPVVYGRALKVNPIVTILAVLVGASPLGILGALLAIPIAAAIQILLRDWWTHRPAAVVSDAYAPTQNGSTGELVQP